MVSDWLDDSAAVTVREGDREETTSDDSDGVALADSEAVGLIDSA